MYQIRKGVFETNSSSTHSITFMSESEYDAWKNGEVYLNNTYGSSSQYADKKFVTRDEAIDILKYDKYYDDHFWNYDYESDVYPSPEELDDDGLAMCGIYTFKHYMWDSYLESDESSYVTDSGEKIYAVCKYGHD